MDASLVNIEQLLAQDPQLLDTGLEESIIFASAIEDGYLDLYLRENARVRTSVRQGPLRMSELLSGDDGVFRQLTRMNKAAFKQLCHELRDLGMKDHVETDVEQDVFICIRVLAGNTSNRIMQDDMSRSGATVSKAFHRTMHHLMQLYPKYVKLPASGSSPSPRLEDGLYRHFEGCLGALDGSHILAQIDNSSPDKLAFKNRKKDYSQNVLAVVSLEGEYLYALAGWPGSAHDSKVLGDAYEQGFTVPNGKFYLGDAGYALTARILTPYRHTRYHLSEQPHNALQAVRSKEELFNLYHARLRNVIERAFGVLKMRFQALKYGPRYPFLTQIDMVYAAILLSNFIRVWDQTAELELLDEYDHDPEHPDLNAAEDSHPSMNDNAGDVLREQIATALWTEHLNRRRHGL